MSQTPETLFEQLRRLQEPKGYFFNPDKEMTLALLESLLINKERLKYMACPCRLANGELDKDRDILCPCVYREADVAEYGACYCGLYVSKELHDAGKEAPVVPERRPVEKILL
jgi:ferredoxin-thioredoxin reductase catalytic subunit